MATYDESNQPEQRTIVCPFNSSLRIELDKDEIIPEDPGAGTPAMVYKGSHSGTWWCVDDNGEFWDGEELTYRERQWVAECGYDVDAFMAYWDGPEND
jgi:hypothetical protein